MATKPTEQPEIWASATNYTSGPKVGQPTKASSEAGAAIEGHKPGPTEPTTANEFNVFENKVSLLARWAFAGRFDKLDDAHIVETDINGLLSARAADFGDPTKPGPSLSVINSNTDWGANFAITDADGVRIQGIYAATQSEQLMFVDTTMDNTGTLAALRVRCSSSPSCGGIRIESEAQGIIAGQDQKAGLSVFNQGGIAAQIRSRATTLAALRVMNLTDDGTSARFGHTQLDTSGETGLDSTAIDCLGGNADPVSGNVRAGAGIITQGGDHDAGSGKEAGYGILALSGLSDGAAPGGAAGFFQSVGTRSLAIDASHNNASATLPVIQATTGENLATAVAAVSTGGGNAIQAHGQLGYGVAIDMFEDGALDVAAGLNLGNQRQPTMAKSTGNLWLEQGAVGTLNLRTHLNVGSEEPAYIRVGYQAPCYIRTALTTHVMSGSPTDQLIIASFSWEPGLVPATAAVVRVTLWGKVSQDTNSTVSERFEVRDLTEVGDPTILTMSINTPDVGIVGLTLLSTTNSDIYQLPAAGNRSFDLVWTGDAGAVNGQFQGYVEIEGIPGK